MEILDIRPCVGAGNLLARFDAKVTDHIRMYNLKLMSGNRGPRVYAPQAFGASSATFHPDLANELGRAAMAALDRVNAGVRDAA